MYEYDLALNNLQLLISYKAKLKQILYSQNSLLIL